jgi:hypothetical protein
LSFVSSVLTDDTKAQRKGPDDAEAKIKVQMIQRPKEKDR